MIETTNQILYPYTSSPMDIPCSSRTTSDSSHLRDGTVDEGHVQSKALLTRLEGTTNWWPHPP